MVQTLTYDIAQTIGGITTPEGATELFRRHLNIEQRERIDRIRNGAVRIKIANAIALCQPDRVFIHTGSATDRKFIRRLAMDNGEEQSLAMEGHSIHFDLKEEQGRIIDRTFYIVNPDETVSSLANKILRDDALKDIRDKMGGIMKGATMLVGFYNRGPIGAPVSDPALEITSSAYVMHSADILYRHAFDCFDEEVERQNHFYANLHSQGPNRPEDLPNARVYMDRQDRTTYSCFCTYAGNTLLLKKGNHRFSVDKSVYQHRGRQLAEHMFITGIQGSDDRITWFAGAAPSGCGKTTTAMAGDHFLGDDLAQMWIAADGTVRSVNPECGIFGIVEDVNWNGDPLLMEILRKPGHEVIWTNVLIDANRVPQWTGNGEPVPEKGVNFQGEWWPGKTDEKGHPIPMSHPNARCTVSARALSTCSEALEDPAGVETRVITYSGRDSDTMPPVWVAKGPDEGVVIGACIVSAATATEVGARGVKRSPWANAPFIPGALGDYMDGQFKFFSSPDIADDKRPAMAGLNYFLTHEARGGEGRELLGEKRDVKVWMAWIERCVHREVEAIETPIGHLPRYADLKRLFADLIAKDYPRALYDKQFSLYIDNILARIDLQIGAYRQEPNVPVRLFEVLYEQRGGLTALRQVFGPVVTPDQLSGNC
ncbi:MAG: phosphoenolpyruvate carboxykinase (GTP) [Desulfobacterales bacterium]|nr:phosphoenolpyruvate carboxykinase (GTP) [Desulfobacteraceae bacterium]MDY0311381.1 phosphoenolpyruvate carboxykinase (GTP) [Desulfobacterales bacterium]